VALRRLKINFTDAAKQLELDGLFPAFSCTKLIDSLPTVGVGVILPENYFWKYIVLTGNILKIERCSKD